MIRKSILKKPNILIILLLFITLGKGLIWTFSVPIFQAPDEPQHYSYVQYLVENKRFPQVKKLDFEPSKRLEKQLELLETEQIAHNPHIQHSFYRAAGKVSPNDLLKDPLLNKLDPHPGELNYVHNYGPLYYALNTPFYLLPDLPSQVYSMRVFSIILSCITVLFAFLFASEAKRKFNLKLPKNFPFLFALLVSLQPQFTFIGSTINSDNLINLLFALFFYLSIRFWGEKPTIKRIFLLFLLGFAGFFTKTQGVLLLILITIYLCWQLFTFKLSTQSSSKSKPTVRDTHKIALVLSGLGLSIFASASIFYEQVLNGFLGKAAIFATYFAEHSIPWFLQTITFTRLFRSYKSFWGRYGWLDTLLPEWMYYALSLLIVLGLIGLIVWLVTYWRKGTKKSPNSANNGFVGFVIFLLLSIFIVDFTYMILFAKNAILFEYYNFPTQGRYYFIVLVPIMYLLSFGLINLVREKWRCAIMWASIYALFFIQVVSLLAIIPIRYYL